MGYFGEFVQLTTTTELLILSILTLLCVYLLTNNGKRKLPPGPRGLPILGYLPFMRDEPAVELIKLSKKYGDVFSLYLGRRFVVVVANYMKARELFSKQSASDRPSPLFALLPGGAGFGEQNGERWIEQRRYTIREMKNIGFGSSDWEKLVNDEVMEFLDILKKAQGKPVDVLRDLSASISNNVMSLVSGRRIPTGHPKRTILDKGIESFELIHGQSGLVANYPSIFRFCVRFGLLSTAHVKNIQNMSSCLRQEIENLKHEKNGDSYIHKYFNEIEKNKQLNLGNSFNDETLFGNVQALVIAGSDTTKVSLLWLFLAMASFPHIQEKVHKEVDTVFGKDGNATWVDRNKLPYCHATILECQRWRSVAPLNVVHSSNEDISIDGYVIPKGTDIIAPISAFHSDTGYWKDPDAFQPERFMAKDGTVIKEPESFMPFSYGKRICPGKTVALIEIFLYFVAIMQKFRILPESENKQPDIVGTTGLTLQPKKQLLRYILR